MTTECAQMHNAHEYRMCTMHMNTNCAQMHNAHEYSAQLVSNRASVGNCHLASSLPPCHSRSHTFHSESFTLFNLPRMLYSLYVPTVYFSQFYPLTLVTQGRIRFTLRVFTLFNLSKMPYSLFLLYAFL